MRIVRELPFFFFFCGGTRWDQHQLPQGQWRAAQLCQCSRCFELKALLCFIMCPSGEGGGNADNKDPQCGSAPSRVQGLHHPCHAYWSEVKWSEVQWEVLRYLQIAGQYKLLLYQPWSFKERLSSISCSGGCDVRDTQGLVECLACMAAQLGGSKGICNVLKWNVFLTPSTISSTSSTASHAFLVN